MDMEDLFWIFILVLSVTVGTLLACWGIKLAIRRKETAFAQMISQLDEMLTQIPRVGYGQLNPQQQDQITQMLMRTHTQFGQFNDLARQRYDTQVAGIMGMAVNAGIDWTPPS